MSKKNKLTKDELSKVQELTKEGQDFLTSIGRIEFQKSLRDQYSTKQPYYR